MSATSKFSFIDLILRIQAFPIRSADEVDNSECCSPRNQQRYHCQLPAHPRTVVVSDEVALMIVMRIPTNNNPIILSKFTIDECRALSAHYSPS